MAYASVRRYRVQADALDEISRRVQTEFVPIVRQVAGFQAYYLIDGGNGELVTVSVFEDRESAEESTRRASTWVNENLAQYVQGAPQVTIGDVTVSAS